MARRGPGVKAKAPASSSQTQSNGRSSDPYPYIPYAGGVMRNRSVGGQRDRIDACGLRDRELAKGQGEGSLEGGDMDDEESGGRKGILSPNTPRRRTMAEGPSQPSLHAKTGI